MEEVWSIMDGIKQFIKLVGFISWYRCHGFFGLECFW